MFSLHGLPTRLCDGIGRRELLRIGGLSVLGLSLESLLRTPAAAAPSAGGTFGRAKNVIFLWLQGGPPQHETFDPKPEAPVEIRGPFKAINTNVPSIHFSELLPRTARIADKLAIIRSMSTNDNNHDGSGYWILTGNKYRGVNSREIRPTDWPYFGSIVKMLKPSEQMAPLTSVWLPDVMRLNDNVRPAGQTAGFLGPQWDPERFICDPSQPGFSIEGLQAPAELPPLRLERRISLLEQVQRHFEFIERGASAKEYDKIQQDALGLLTSGQARRAFAIDSEPEALRERYGRHKWGQCVLLARRLIEAGVRLVHVNWPREPGDTAVSNPLWDTHAQNADRLQDMLCPQFDVTFTALIEDLEARGLLDETLVVAAGEFGRTPKINGLGGRDHWGAVFSLALAGAGISGGQVYGASDKIGAQPASHRVEPQDFVATIFHLLGIDRHAMFPDRIGRPLPVTLGEPLHQLLGSAPATPARCEPTGDLAFVPPYDPRPMLNGDFKSAALFHPLETQTRVKGWRAAPLWSAQRPTELAIRLVEAAAPRSFSGVRHVAIGYGAEGAPVTGQIAAGSQALLTQELKSPRAGRYTFALQACGRASSAEYYRDVFLQNFACRLVIFGYVDLKKDPHQMRVYANVPFVPAYCEADEVRYQRFEALATLRSQDAGAAEIERGVGVSLFVEKTTPGNLPLTGEFAWFSFDDAELAFNPRPRDDSVQV
ncbi:MAG TPA: DUF1501 domain-containing protein [Pirellulales bacterium]|nr:DUF1501 domain-containing protein [Pirellulales bacterium]